MNLVNLFKQFLIVGSSSFGGYSALIAVVQKIFVDKLKVLKDSVIVEGFSLSSLLPGPVAVNTVTYIGFNLASWRGALVSLTAVVLPSMLFMIVLSIIYAEIGVVPEVKKFMIGVIPIIIALIITVIINMGKKSLDHVGQYFILLVSLIAQFFFSGYWVFFATIIFGAVLGFILYRPIDKTEIIPKRIIIKWYHIVILLFLGGALSLNFLDMSNQSILLQLFSVFSGVSLTLFGGGYVMIPMLEELVVGRYGWLTSVEFIDAIVLGQATPGPILISATFVGYKVAGILGALVSTIAIFLPSALLITVVADLFSKRSQNFKPIIKGIRPVVIGLMISSIWILLQGFDSYYYPLITGLIASFILIRFQVHFLWLILAAGTLGILIL